MMRSTAPERAKGFSCSSPQYELMVECCYGCTNEGPHPEYPLQINLSKFIRINSSKKIKEIEIISRSIYM